MLKTRILYHPILNVLEKEFDIQTFNELLIHSLEKDLSEESEFTSTTVTSFNESTAIGTFYVLAGSSNGGKQILKMAQKAIPYNTFYYLSVLNDTAEEQMKALTNLLSVPNIDPEKMIQAAKETFDFIHQTAHELRRRNKKFQSA